MGFNLFGSSSESQNESTDNRAVGDGGALVATGRGQITVHQSSADALAVTRDALAGTFEAIRDSNENAQNIANRALGTTQSTTFQIVEQAVPVLIVGAIIWGLSR